MTPAVQTLLIAAAALGAASCSSEAPAAEAEQREAQADQPEHLASRDDAPTTAPTEPSEGHAKAVANAPATSTASSEPVTDAHVPPKLERVAPGQYRISTPRSVVSTTATPLGVAFVTRGVLWHARLDTKAVEKIENAVDLHALASDDESLYWLGRFGNGRYEYESGKKGWLPSFAGRGMQEGLTVGRFLYGLTSEGAVWKLGNHVSQVNPRMPSWRIDSTILAGSDVVMVRALDVEGAEGIENIVYRIRVNEKGRRMYRDGERFRMDGAGITRDGVDEDGRLVFAVDGAVYVLGSRSKTPERLFDVEEDASPCWCGKDICVLVDDPLEVRRHRRTTAGYEVIATVRAPAYRLRCNDKHVTWFSGRDADAAVNVIALTK